VVSDGPEQVTVPDLVGSNVDDARDQLEEAGLTADVTREESEREPGTVLRQDPAPNTRADRGSTVRIVVARERSDVAVPDVVGRSESEAAAAIAAAGLEVNVRETDVTRPSQDGVVQRQSPSSGSRLERGRRVTITVGRFSPDLDPDPGDDGGENGGSGSGGTGGSGSGGTGAGGSQGAGDRRTSGSGGSER
jgi:eukaryotic-like serine/threonine-protein kinase